MEALLRKGIIDFLSIFLSSLILLYFAEWLIPPYIFHPILIGFITVSVLVAVFLDRSIKMLEGIWGNALSIFIAVMVVAFLWSGFSPDSLLFVFMAVPSSILSIILWKIWDSRSVAVRPIAKRLPASVYKRKK